MKLATLGLAVAFACAAAGAQPAQAQNAGDSPVIDARAQFRPIFCSLIARDSPAEGECDKWLRRAPGEAAGAPVAPGELRARYDLLVVPGIYGECASSIVTVFGDAAPSLAGKGVRSETIAVRGRASSEFNARIIRDAVLRHQQASPGKRVVLVTYSKGTADTLVALAAYPEIVPHIAAQVSFAGVVRGSPLADEAEGIYGLTVGQLPLPVCPVADSGEVKSLRRTERQAWLASHQLPASVRFYSVVTMPEPSRVSAALLPAYVKLASVDPANDSQVIASDQVIPGGKLLGYVNADHWAVAIPFNTAPLLVQLLVDKNSFPRSRLLEAALMVVEGDGP